MRQRSSYYYVSQKKRDIDFWMHEIRFIPNFIPKELRNRLVFLEEQYRARRIDRRRIAILATYLKYKFGIDYRIIDDNTIVFLPHSHYALVKYFSRYPNLMSIIGDRHSGKTITAWDLAFQMLDRIRGSKLYVYGDVDNLGYTLIEKILEEKYRKRIIIKEDYRLPPLDGKPKIVLYNELSETLMGKRALSSENIELNLQALRSRHLNTWVIYNVIRHGTLESVLRETTNIFLFKWMSGAILENAIKIAPRGWKELLKITTHFDQNQALAIVPVLGKGNTFFIHDTDPPEWLLKAHHIAKKNRRLLLVKSEREREIILRIAELKEDPEKEWTNEEIRLILQKEFNFSCTTRTIQNKYKTWKKLTGVEE